MRAKAVLGIALVAMLVLAVLPQAWAVVVDDSYRYKKELSEKYGIPLNEYGAPDSEKIVKKLLTIPEDQLTIKEAMVLLQWYSAKAGQSGSDELFWQNLKKAEHYFNLIVQKDPDYVPAYLALGNTYAIEASTRHDVELQKKAIELGLKTLEINPDGIIIGVFGKGSGWNSMANGLEDLKYDYGYNVPDDLIKWFREASIMAENGEIKTKDDLKRIGFYEKRDEVLRVLEKKPLLQRVMDAIPVGSTQTKGLIAELLRIHKGIAIAAGAIFASLLFLGALWFRRRRAAAA